MFFVVISWGVMILMVIKLKTRIFFYFLTEVCVKLVDELET